MKTSLLFLLIAIPVITHNSLATPTLGIRAGLNLATVNFFDGRNSQTL